MGHSYTCLFFHIVWSTKKRLPLISPLLKEKLHRFIKFSVKDEGADLLAIGGTHNHVHLLIKTNTNCVISKLVRQIKTRSTKFANNEYKGLSFFAWQEGYSIFSVSNSNINKIIRYINRQEEHHRDLFIEEELQLLFKT